jgi:hypothetical protein
VLVHYPVFNIGGHASAWGHTNYLPLFHQSKVDLVLAGHSLIYERFRPVAPRAAQTDWAITCITTGGGGAPLHPYYDHLALLVRAATNHYLVLEATRVLLKGNAFRADGKTLDSFELKKTNGQLPADYLTQVYAEESLKLVSDAAPSLGGRVAALPTVTKPAYVMLPLRPCRSTPQPAELEITFTPESARYYELENAPLRATTPPKGVTNQVLWGKVRATGKKKITEGKDRALSPPLVFQARVNPGADETLAYGAKYQLSRTAAAAAKKL